MHRQLWESRARPFGNYYPKPGHLQYTVAAQVTLHASDAWDVCKERLLLHRHDLCAQVPVKEVAGVQIQSLSAAAGSPLQMTRELAARVPKASGLFTDSCHCQQVQGTRRDLTDSPTVQQ